MFTHAPKQTAMLAVFTCCLAIPPAHADPAESDLSPFVLPWDDGADGPTSLAFLNHVPAGKFGPVRVGDDGHFHAGKDRIRFLGVNVCFGATVPDAQPAGPIAARMAKFGVNVVRFHHMDGYAFPGGIVRRGGGSGELDPQAMERLSNFVAQLKAHGIYANLNLLVSRAFRAGDGLPAEIDSLDWKLRHTVAMYYAPMIELQKQYARDLLTHRNPETKLRFAEDPAVAFVEINNENGLLMHWLSGDLDALPGSLGDDLARQWNGWLKERYKTTSALRKSWKAAPEPLGAELLAPVDEPADPNGRGRWNLERHAGAAATSRVERNVAGRSAALRIEVEKTGRESWHVQFNHPGLSAKADRIYTLAFSVRADRARTVSVNLGQAHDPWHGLGFDTRVEATPEWRVYTYTIVPAVDDDNARINFGGLGSETGTVWLAGVSLRPGGNLGLEPGETLEKATVPIVQRNSVRAWPRAARRDFVRFLWDAEQRYWQTMRRFVTEDLGFKGIVMGTIVACSTPNLQAAFDAVDGHAYWTHPDFPGRPWDAEDWIVRNVSMVNQPGGPLAGLSMERVAGKPFTVTEYNHASPNTYSGEAPLLLAAQAGFQDWDGIFLFAYGHSDRWDSGRIDGFFDIGQHPVKMANTLAAALLYRAGHVAPARERVTRTLDPGRELDVILHQGRAWRQVALEHLGVDPVTALLHGTAIQTVASTADEKTPAKPDDLAKLTSDTNELIWDRTRNDKGVVLVNTPKSKAVIGFVGGRSFDLGDVTVAPGKTVQDWCTLCLSLVEGESFSTPGRAILVATGWTQNTSMRWKDAEHSSVGRQWGTAPSLIEVVPARITLPVPPQRLEAWSLDERGQRDRKLTPQAGPPGTSSLDIDREPTLWYEIAIRSAHESPR